MALKVIHIPESDLGTVVELRELTMDGFLKVQQDDAQEGLPQSINYLAHMLYVDGVQMTRAQIGECGMTEILKLVSRMNELFPDEGEEGNA